MTFVTAFGGQGTARVAVRTINPELLSLAALSLSLHPARGRLSHAP